MKQYKRFKEMKKVDMSGKRYILARVVLPNDGSGTHSTFEIYENGNEIKQFPATNNTNGKIAAENYFDGFIDAINLMNKRIEESVDYYAKPYIITEFDKY